MFLAFYNLSVMKIDNKKLIQVISSSNTAAPFVFKGFRYFSCF